MIFTKLSAFGLDLSDLSIKLAWLKKTDQQLNLASFNRQEIKDGIIEDGVIKNEAELIDLIKKTVREANGENITTRNCIVSLPESESYIRVIQLPKIKNEEIAEAIKWEMEANIPVPLEDIYFDWQVVRGEGQTDDHINVLIGTLPKKLVDPYLEVIKKAGLKPLAFEIESIATVRALVSGQYCQDPIMILDLGSRRTSLIIFYYDTIWFTTGISISNNDLIYDIAKVFKVDFQKAKKIKFDDGLDAKENPKAYGAMEPRILELVSEINKYFSYFQTTNLAKKAAKTNISKIILSGGGANLKGFGAFLASHLNVSVEIGNPWINILTQNSNKLPKIPFDESLAYTTVLGLALRGIR